MEEKGVKDVCYAGTNMLKGNNTYALISTAEDCMTKFHGEMNVFP